MKTYFDIIRDVSNLRWSVVDSDLLSFAEVQKSVKLAITQANSYIWSLSDFPFKIKKDAFTLNKGQQAIVAPKGNIVAIWINGSQKYLEQISQKDADFLSIDKQGTPVKYWLEFGDKGAQIHFYPAPDKPYVVLMRYSSNYKAKSNTGELKTNLVEMDDVLNIPQDKTIEDLYLHCLNTKTMEYLIADSKDENYAPYQKEFLEAYKTLIQFTGVNLEPKIVI